MRRTLAWLLCVAAILGLVTVGTGSLSAQDAEMASHPLVGAWELVPGIGDGDTSCHSHVSFYTNGSYIEVDCDGVVSLGTWEPTGPSSATMTVVSGNSDDGYYKIRAAIDVAADGQSFTAPFTFELIDPETGAGMGEYGPGMATATRLVAEAPGTPIAPITDLFQ